MDEEKDGKEENKPDLKAVPDPKPEETKDKVPEKEEPKVSNKMAGKIADARREEREQLLKNIRIALGNPEGGPVEAETAMLIILPKNGGPALATGDLVTMPEGVTRTRSATFADILRMCSDVHSDVQTIRTEQYLSAMGQQRAAKMMAARQRKTPGGLVKPR